MNRRTILGLAVALAATLTPAAAAQAAVTIERTSAADTAEGDAAVFTVSRSFVLLGQTATVKVTLEGVTCGEDVTLGTDCSTTFALSPFGGSQSVAVETHPDSLYEGDEALTARIAVTGDSGSNGTAGTTIVDGDAPPVLSVADAAAGEGAPLIFTVTKAGRSARSATARWTAAPAAGTEAADLGSPLSGDVTIPAGATSATISVPTAQDPTDEPQEAATLTLGVPVVDATLGDATATGTIADDDEAPAATVAAAQATEGDPLSFGLTLARASELPVSVAWTTTPGSATAADLAGEAAGTLVIPAGQTTGTIAVATAEDAVYEGDETFTLGVPGSTAPGTIVEDDAKPTIEVFNAQPVAEGGQLHFPVTRSGHTARASRVAWSVDAGPGDVSGARSGVIEMPPSAELPGAPAASVLVDVADDVVDELDETLTLTLTALPDGDATVGDPASGTGTVTDDDTAAVSVVAATAEEGDGNVHVPVVLSTPSDRNVSVGYRTVAGTATPGVDYEDRNGRITVPAGQTAVLLALPLRDDTEVEGDETYDVVLSDPEPAGTPIAAAQATQTIRSADVAPTPDPGSPSPGTPTDPVDTSGTGTETPAAPVRGTTPATVTAQGPRFPDDDTTAPKPVVTGLKLKGSMLSVRFSCPAGERLCRGTLSVLTVPNAKAKNKRLRKERALGSRVAVVQGGKSATFTLKLSKANRKLLKGKRFRAVAYAVVRDAAGNVGTASAKATLKGK